MSWWPAHSIAQIKNILLSIHRAKYFHIYQNFLHKSFDRVQVLNFLYISSTCIKQMLIYIVGKV